jgi:hypothetical protein
LLDFAVDKYGLDLMIVESEKLNQHAEQQNIIAQPYPAEVSSALQQRDTFDVLSFHDYSQTTTPYPPSAAPTNTKLTSQATRVVVYESPFAAPRIIMVPFSSPADSIESLTTTSHKLCRELGSPLPYTIIRALVENLVHADFAEPVISILDAGKTLRIADQGKGITHKDLALIPGFSTATRTLKEIIAGVGSGLPTVNCFAESEGGNLSIEDNLAGGTVVTLSLTAPQAQKTTPAPNSTALPVMDALPLSVGGRGKPAPAFAYPSMRPQDAAHYLSERQKEVLSVVSDYGLTGPSGISDLLGISLTTAYRDLEFLERRKLLSSSGGKRSITPEGSAYLDTYVYKETP